MWDPIYKTSLVCLVLLAIPGGWALYRKPVQERHVLLARKAELEKYIEERQIRLDSLKHKQEQLQNDPRFVEKLAREEFGYARPGETVFKFEGDAARRN